MGRPQRSYQKPIAHKVRPPTGRNLMGAQGLCPDQRSSASFVANGYWDVSQAGLWSLKNFWSWGTYLLSRHGAESLHLLTAQTWCAVALHLLTAQTRCAVALHLLTAQTRCAVALKKWGILYDVTWTYRMPATQTPSMPTPLPQVVPCAQSNPCPPIKRASVRSPDISSSWLAFDDPSML